MASTLSVTVNQAFGLNLDLDTSTDQVSAAELHLTFDPTKLKVESFTASDTLVVLSEGEFDNDLGLAAITVGAQPNSPLTGKSTLAVLNFTPLVEGDTTVSYDAATQTASVGKTGNSLLDASGCEVTVTPLVITPNVVTLSINPAPVVTLSANPV